ncbi:hypothetical protein OG252_43255 [Streptomyces sp. NBC_01352]|uniref:hypothetical protein n=1 Tax=unclassified Streptomyces TaxID=2593676 RepID=UPI002256783E|nr:MULTISPECIES: hypothetical protein [unclassified Streptomyces]MCX4702816.1 hypothetical protein [Streptomyces sp. NBC_01373]
MRAEVGPVKPAAPEWADRCGRAVRCERPPRSRYWYVENGQLWCHEPKSTRGQADHGDTGQRNTATMSHPVGTGPRTARSADH